MYIVNDILDVIFPHFLKFQFSRLEASELTLQSVPFQIRDVFTELSQAFVHRVEALGLDFLSYIDPGLPKIIGDPQRLKQSFKLNFIFNY